MFGRLEDEQLCRGDDLGGTFQGRKRKSPLRPQRRRRFVGSGSTDAKGSRQAADLRICRSRTCRKDEGDQVEAVFGPAGSYDLNFIRVDARQRFYDRLAGVTEPEAKRKIIGEEFIRVFEEEAKKSRRGLSRSGNRIPDVIESGLGKSAVIKSHHNVGGLPDHVDFKEIIEPLKMLFKDEVRKAGLELGIPESLSLPSAVPRTWPRREDNRRGHSRKGENGTRRRRYISGGNSKGRSGQGDKPVFCGAYGYEVGRGDGRFQDVRLRSSPPGGHHQRFYDGRTRQTPVGTPRESDHAHSKRSRTRESCTVRLHGQASGNDRDGVK